MKKCPREIRMNFSVIVDFAHRLKIFRNKKLNFKIKVNFLTNYLYKIARKN